MYVAQTYWKIPTYLRFRFTSNSMLIVEFKNSLIMAYQSNELTVNNVHYFQKGLTFFTINYTLHYFKYYCNNRKAYHFFVCVHDCLGVGVFCVYT
jgi:hypothetical protein